MPVDLYAAPYVGDNAVGIDDKGGALETKDGLSVEHLVFENPVLIADGPVPVAEQGEGKFVLRLELLVGFDAVAAHTEHHGTFCCKVVDFITEIDGLTRSARGVVFGVKI